MRHIDPDIALARKVMPAGYCFETKQYDKFQLILVQKGILRMQVYKRDMYLDAGCIAMLRMDSKFKLSSTDGYEGLGIIVETPSLPALQGNSRALQAGRELMMTAELIESYLLIPNSEGKHAIRNLARAMIWQALDVEKKQLTKHSEKWPEIAKGVLDVNLATGMSARAALAHLPLCYRQISRLFKSTYGVSPKQYQLAARIGEAKRLLAGGDTGITETAMELGFSSSQHFATQFKDFTGMTPREFSLSSPVR